MKLSTGNLSMKDPEELVAALRSEMGWGPVNSGAAVRAKFCCEYCDDCLLDSVTLYYSWEIDHIVPGNDDDLENCALACRTCNHLKHSYPPKGFTREDRIKDARREIGERRQRRDDELAKVRALVGWHSATGA
jgi:5-methylcytosine-specific restriction endonuclease McrA